MKTIANAMCVLNEEEFLAETLQSILPGLDQCIVIDQGSTDETLNILRKMERYHKNLHWIETRGQNFLNRGEQFFRKLAVDLCFCDWMMVTDGDEVMGNNWWEPVRDFINSAASENVGAIRGDYWQMIGSIEYMTPSSPLQPETGERPLFYRRLPAPKISEPMVALCHVAYELPQGFGQHHLSGVDCFHMGYAKRDLEARFMRNIDRGDWSTDPKEMAEFRKRAEHDPLQFLPECVPTPSDIRQRLPDSILLPRRAYQYDEETKRLSR